VWLRIPKRNLEVRPEIATLLLDAQHRAALQADGEFPFPEPPAAPSAVPAAGGPPPAAVASEFAPGFAPDFARGVSLSTPLSLTLNLPAPVSAPPYFEPPIMLAGTNGTGELNGTTAPAYVEPPAASPATNAPEPPAVADAIEKPGTDFAQSLPLPPEVTGTVSETPLPLWSASNWANARGVNDVPAGEE
jgi:hypothetical protein